MLRRIGPAHLLLLAAVPLTGCGGTVDVDRATRVTRSERMWIDASRSTPRTSQYVGAIDRTLRVVVWRPEGAVALPLVLLAHGFGGLPEKFDAFARTLAAAGFVVGAPAFPLTNQDAPGGHEPGFRDFVNQPADLSFVLTQILEASTNSGDPLHGAIDPTQVGLLGHSLGGATAIGLTRKTCCMDERVHAVILFAAVVPLADAFGSDAVVTGLPTLIVHGTADRSVPYSTAPAYYDAIGAPRFLLGLIGVGHSEALESQVEAAIHARDAAQRASIAFFDTFLRSEPAAFGTTLAEFAGGGDTVVFDPGSLN